MTDHPDAARRSRDGSADPVHVPAEASSRFVEVAGLRLHLLDYGTAGRRPMLCLHGGAANAHWYDFVAGALVGDHHVVSLDMRGHGESDWAVPPDYAYARFADDVEAVAELLDLRDFVLIGHSMGGMVALTYAARRPQRLGRLVVVDSTMRMTEERVSGLQQIGARPGRRTETLDGFVERYRLRPPGSGTPPEILRRMAEHSARHYEDGWGHQFDRNVYSMRGTADAFPLWARLEVPVLLVKGAQSDRITVPVESEIRASCAHVEVAEVAPSGHHVTLDNPEGFVRAVTPFLRAESR
ncbi:MAG: alpha/beta hydrolase [Ectothiorhodospiraceae bacterium]|nr:alpha/beta hydrolase [Ectothiorhodospiraceae bacterium]